MTAQLLPGQVAQVPYTTRVGGQPVNVVAAGGHVDSLQLFATPDRTGPAAATATLATPTLTGAVFTIVAPTVVGTYYAVVAYTPYAGGPQYLDVDDVVIVQAYAGDLGPTAIATVGQLKAVLNIYDDTTDDALLASFITRVSAIADHWCGPTIPRTVADVIDPGRTGDLVWPTILPVLQVTSLTDAVTGAAVGGPMLLPDGSVLLTSAYSGYGYCNPWVLTYVAGRPDVPEGITDGLLEVAKQRWDQTQRGFRTGADEVDNSTAFSKTHMGYAIPNRTLQLWGPYLRGPGLA